MLNLLTLSLSQLSTSNSPVKGGANIIKLETNSTHYSTTELLVIQRAKTTSTSTSNPLTIVCLANSSGVELPNNLAVSVSLTKSTRVGAMFERLADTLSTKLNFTLTRRYVIFRAGKRQF